MGCDKQDNPVIQWCHRSKKKKKMNLIYFMYKFNNINFTESTGYSGKCEDNIQCSAVLQAGGQCNKGKCQCADGFHYLHGKCIRSMGK